MSLSSFLASSAILKKKNQNTGTPYIPIIAIDGPSGSGKSTVARQVAERLNLTYIDTGAMYRALAYKMMILDQVSPFEMSSEQLLVYLKNLNLSYGSSKENLISIDGENLTEKIRNQGIADFASKISTVGEIRQFLVLFQRDLSLKNPCVMEGRDITSVVAPDAFCKIYLTASAQERAKRRMGQLSEGPYEKILVEILERDERDMTRKDSPLTIVSDAIVIDSSDVSAEKIVEKIVDIVKKNLVKISCEKENRAFFS